MEVDAFALIHNAILGLTLGVCAMTLFWLFVAARSAYRFVVRFDRIIIVALAVLATAAVLQ